MNVLMRRGIWPLLLLPVLAVGPAQAAEFLSPSEESARLVACVVRERVPQLEAQEADAQAAPRLMRARLVFVAPDQEPSVELLWNGLDGAAGAVLERYLRSYRMPCMEHGAPAQAAVQEFWVNPRDGSMDAGVVWPTAVPGKPASCYEEPAQKLAPPRSVSGPARVLAYFRFPADGSEPEVAIKYATGSREFASAVRSHIKRYASCSGGRTQAGWHQQVFNYNPDGVARPQFRPMDLAHFLGSVRNAAQLRANFDLNTMACPFKVRWTLQQPAEPNSASSVGEQDPNRAAFLGWLGSLDLDLPASAQSAMVTESVEIDVPCIRLQLQPDAAGRSTGPASAPAG